MEPDFMPKLVTKYNSANTEKVLRNNTASEVTTEKHFLIDVFLCASVHLFHCILFCPL